MNKQLLGFFICLFVFTSLSAQKIVPLAGYDFLRPTGKDASLAQPKMDCSNLMPDGLIQVTAGDSVNLSIDVDTSGFGAGSGFVCQNCSELNAGSVTTTSNRITYYANSSTVQALDTLNLTFCNVNGDSCSSVETLILLVQRPAQTFDFPVETLGPQERIEIIVPDHNLPGEVICRAFIDCPDDYLGSEQQATFLNGLGQTNNFRYDAARYAGTDKVCLVLCNEYGLCDQYNYFFEIVRANVNLPFFDDFSIESNRPDINLWQNEDVLINRGLPINPPSIGVATFDAVGPRGQPINDNTFGPRDYLTSTGINLAGAGNTTLTFYVQPRGFGNRPERQDSLSLQFLRPDGVWQHAWSMRGRSTGEGNCSDIPFTSQVVEVPDLYKYDGFQFRFFNYSSQSGALDHWHLDYVKLSDQATEINLNDIALIQNPPFVTKPYSAIPYRQLVAAGGQLVRDTFTAGVWDHANLNDARPASQASLTIEESTTSQQLSAIPLEALGLIPGGTPHIVNQIPNSGTFNAYSEALRGLDNSTNNNYRVVATYDLGGGFTEADTPGFTPFVTTNNTASSTTLLGDVYAYDDGTAELAVEALPGQTVVQRYEAFTDEVLRGVSIRLPRTTSSTNDELAIELVVYLGELTDGNVPDHSIIVNPIYVENAHPDSLSAFTSYAFPDSIDIPTGPFFVGWKQIGNCSNCVPVGMDRNSLISGTRYFRNGSRWFEFDGCSTGALMIRPLVGDSQVFISSTQETNNEMPVIRLYPNPARDFVKLQALNNTDINHIEWHLFSLSGKQLQHGQTAQINISAYPAGIYLLKVMDSSTGQLSQHKFIIE